MCLHCRKIQAHPWKYESKPSGTLKRHLNSCSSYRESQRIGSGSQLSSKNQFFPVREESPSQSITKALIDQQVLKFVISANLSFNTVENEYFRELISWIKVNNRPAQAPSRKVVHARLSTEAKSAKEDLKTILAANKSKISLAMDCWSSRTNFGFLGTSIIWQEC
jgi:hypothetical protein